MVFYNLAALPQEVEFISPLCETEQAFVAALINKMCGLYRQVIKSDGASPLSLSLSLSHLSIFLYACVCVYVSIFSFIYIYIK